MAFSLRKLLEQATAQINPFDKGKTAATVRAAQKPLAARPPRPQQSVFNKVRDVLDANTEADQYRRIQAKRPRFYADEQRAKGNMRPNRNLLTAGKDIAVEGVVKPVVRTSMAYTQATGNLANKITGYNEGRSENAQEFFRLPSGSTALTDTTGYTGTKQQITGDIATNVLNFGVPGTGGAISKTTTKLVPKVVPKIIPKTIGYAAAGALEGGPSQVANLAATDQPLTRQNVAKALKEGVVAGAAFGGAIPVGGAAFRGSGRLANKTAPVVAKTAKRAVSNPALVELDAQYKQLNQRWNQATSLRARKQIEGAIEANRVERARISQGGYIKNPLSDDTQIPKKAAKVSRPDLSQAPVAGPANVGKRDKVSSKSSVAFEQDLRDVGIIPASRSRDAQFPGVSSSADGLPVRPSSPSRVPTQSIEGTNQKTPTVQSAISEGVARTERPLPNTILESQTDLPLGDVQRFRAKVLNQSRAHRIKVNKINKEGYREVATTSHGRMSKAELENLYATAPSGTQRKLKITKPNTDSNVPVYKMETEGDTVTATNVNKNIQKGEKRYSLDDNGNLIDDTKGPYRVFTDDDGRVTQFRIGKKVFNTKELGDLSDVNDYGSTLATMRRNIERGFGKQTSEKVNRFLVDHQQEQATKMIERHLALKQGMQEIADDLDISFGVGRGKAKKVSAAIQDFGEGARDRASLVQEFGEETANKIVNADGWFRTQYNALLEEMNSVLTAYGYDPVPRRKNYYTHFQDEGLWRSFGLKMQEIRNFGSPTMQDALPPPTRGKISNKLAGESEFTQPNKRFNPYALRRKGPRPFTVDAFKSFEAYLNPTLNNIYMTPSITRARVLAKAVAQDADITGKDANKILVQIKEWANDLAGKSNRFDRPLIDSKGGQVYLKAANWAQRKAGQNTIVGNLSTAVMQPIVLEQAAGKFGFKNTILATIQEMSSAHSKNAPIRQSEFMKRRYADLAPVTASKTDRARNAANTPLKVVEQTSARITWNAAHNDALAKGLKGKDAIRYADIEAEKTLAGRSIGEKPEAFRSRAVGPISMYQLEVNNFWQQFGKEMTKSQAAKTMVAAYGLNLLLQEVTGRQVGFNPIDAAIDSYQETQKEEKSGKDKTIAIGQRFLGEFADNVPFIGQAATTFIGDANYRKLLGKDSQGGRFGVKSPVATLWENPWYAVSPFGGSQAEKTFKGLKGMLEGRLTDRDGETTVEIPQNTPNWMRSLAFGPSSNKEVATYYENIGKKKEDQKQVPNQMFSKAASMGLEGLTKDQQEQFLALPSDQREMFRQASIKKNKRKRTDEKEVETFKQSSNNTKQLSSGKYVVKVGEDYKTYESKEEADLAKAKEEFKSSNAKSKVIGNDYYYKTKSGEVRSKPKFQYYFDQVDKKLNLDMDRAYESNNLKSWGALAQQKYNALEELKSNYDPETEGDKIDAITLQQENLLQKAETYLERGYTKKTGKSKKKSKYDYKLYEFGPSVTSNSKSLRQLVKEATIK